MLKLWTGRHALTDLKAEQKWIFRGLTLNAVKATLSSYMRTSWTAEFDFVSKVMPVVLNSWNSPYLKGKTIFLCVLDCVIHFSICRRCFARNFRCFEQLNLCLYRASLLFLPLGSGSCKNLSLGAVTFSPAFCSEKFDSIWGYLSWDWEYMGSYSILLT